MATKPSISIIGPGRLGQSLARALTLAGYSIREIISSTNKTSKTSASELAEMSHARATILAKAQLDAEVIWFCVPDAQIKPAADRLVSAINWKKKVALHSSGALTSDELNTLRRQGAAVASVHPVMTFVRASDPSLGGTPFGVEGDASALRIARRILKDIGGESFAVRKQDKALYHAWGMFGSPLLLALLVTAEEVAVAAGINAKAARQKILPIAAQTLVNYAALGPAHSFSGPLVRGDAAIVRAHMKALKKIPEAREAYLALAKSALHHLPVRNRKKLKQVLG
jgi:predicted short-subunit dehydrogenase-like oxidoreductase (DUF2520 family)